MSARALGRADIRLTGANRPRAATLILAFPHKGLTGVGLRPGTRASARDTPILTFPRKGGRDPLASVWAWFR